jgi:hypothetical protein
MLLFFHKTFQTFGINLHRFLFSVSSIPKYVFDFIKIRVQLNKNGSRVRFSFNPCLYESHQNAGIAKGHYFHQDLHVASRIFFNHPKKHVDIGSRIDGFVAHVASFREVEVLDIRPVYEKTHSICFSQVDLMKPLPDKFYGYCDSLSCLHALEHFGLGRYGDPIDVNGHKKGLENLILMLNEGGIFYLSVPIGKEQICFNAHRIFNPFTLINELDEKLELKNFSYVDDSGDFFNNVNLIDFQKNIYSDLRYGCGIFEMEKRKT